MSPGTSLILSRLTLSKGRANGRGGAIHAEGNSVLILDRCTLVGHDAAEGGAIFSLGSLSLSQCTLTGNTSSYGGAIQCQGITRMTRCTITGNEAYAGGGIFNKSTTLSVEYSVVAGNSAGGGGGRDIFNENALLEYSGSNVVQSVANSGTGRVSGPAAINAPPLLAPLGKYGGPTQTMPPLRGSPALDAGGTTILDTDQRGLPRLFGSAVDIGAVEANTASPPPTGRYSIGLNFGQSTAPEMLAATDVAGVGSVAQANWNNLSPGSGASTAAILADVNGSAQSTTVKVTWSSAGLWSSTGRGEENSSFTGTDRKLLTGYLDSGNESITQVTISDIPATFTGPTYDVYVYGLGGVGGKGGGYRVTDAVDGSALTDWVRAQSPFNSANYVEVAAGSAVNAWNEGNYIVFRNLDSPSINVIGQTAGGLGFSGSGNPRAPINAIQLVTSSSTGISISRANGLITIQYTGRLESAGQATGPYSPVPGAASPFTAFPDAAAKFYIAR